MLDNLRKKKMLAGLGKNDQKAEYIKTMRDQGADKEALTFLMKGGNKKNTFGEDPIYEEVKKVPYKKQLEMSLEHMDELEDRNEADPRMNDDESDEERKRRMLENLFLSKGQRNS